jgi:hypothetical protein
MYSIFGGLVGVWEWRWLWAAADAGRKRLAMGAGAVGHDAVSGGGRCGDPRGAEDSVGQREPQEHGAPLERIMRNFTYEDFIIEESMGPIADRTAEYLGSSDAVIVRARRMLLDALDEHKAGKLPFGLGENLDYSRIRALAIRFPGETDWRGIDPFDPPKF